MHLLTSIIEWKETDTELPDADTTVLIAHPDWDQTMDFGYLDGRDWRHVDGKILNGNANEPEFQPPLLWAHIPEVVFA